MRTRLTCSLGSFLACFFIGAASPQEHPRTFHILFHDVNGLVVLGVGENDEPTFMRLGTDANITPLRIVSRRREIGSPSIPIAHCLHEQLRLSLLIVQQR